MARLRSFAHLGTTRSGQRRIARWAQSYFPSQSASQVAFSSFCQDLCWGTSRQSGREVDDDAVVEVRLPERRDALHLFEEGAQLLDESLLRGQLLALGSGRAVAQLARQRLEAPLFVRELGRDVVVLDAEERVLAEGVDVEPHRVAR